jgi:uncharacterized membrane-anchored protein
MTRRLKFVIAMFVQFSILGLMIAQAEWTLRSGVRIELEVEPFDPIDPLSGRHLVVRLAANWIEGDRIEPSDQIDLEVGDTLYVTFDVHPKPAVLIRASRTEPPAVVHYAKATVRATGPVVEVDYGLDRFFIPLDATDPSIFRDATGKRPLLRLVARLANGGRIVTEDLLVDGIPFLEWNERQANK